MKLTRPGYTILAMFCVVLLALCTFTGCNKQRNNTDLGAMAGVVLLGNETIDAHAGSMIFLPGTSFSARTDQAGRWTITALPSGSYQVMAEHNGYRTVNLGTFSLDATVHQPGRARELPTIVLEKDESSTTDSKVGRIAGAVAVLDAETGEGVKVVLEDTDKTIVTDEAGLYFFEDVDPGRYVLTFTKNGYQEKQTSVLVRAGTTPSEPKDVILEPVGGSKQLALARSQTATTTTTGNYREAEDNLTESLLKGNCTISGTVQAIDASGQPMTDYSRIIVAIDNSDYQIMPNNAGGFTFSKLPAGFYRVYAVMDMGAGTAYVDVDLTKQQAASVNLKVALTQTEDASTAPGKISGKVVLYGPDGELLEDSSGATVGCIGTNEMALTKNDGTFELSAAEGRYAVQVTKQGYNTELMNDVDVAAGQITDVGTIGLNPNVDAPYIASTMPSDDEDNVTIINKLPVIIIFSKAMNANSVREAVSVSPKLPMNVSIGSGGHPRANDQTLVIELDNTNGKTLKPNQTISVSIAQSATDLEGHKLREAYSFSFKTGSLGIIATSPANGQEVNYLPGSMLPIDIYFNCVLNPSTINSQTLRITPTLNGVSSPPMVMTDPITGWSFVRFTPYLQGGKEYRVTVNRGLKTDSGKSVSDLPYTFSFRLLETNPSGAPPTATRRRQ